MFVYTFENINNIKDLKHSDSMHPKSMRKRLKKSKMVYLVSLIIQISKKNYHRKMNPFKPTMN